MHCTWDMYVASLREVRKTCASPVAVSLLEAMKSGRKRHFQTVDAGMIRGLKTLLRMWEDELVRLRDEWTMCATSAASFVPEALKSGRN